jgi:teichuronic acid biosynthesis glycosyltransferase TuaG
MNCNLSVPVTVVIPCYNSAETIVRAVNSVLAQTVLPSELIMVDDCSTDGGETILVINKLAEQAKKKLQVQVILNEKNAGPASSRNIGWELGVNTLIAFLDSDDIWHPQKIELQYQWMINNPQAVLSGHGTSIYRNCKQFDQIIGLLQGKSINSYNLLWSNPFCTRGVMLQKELPFRFPENMYYAEDFFLWAEISCSYPHRCFVLNCKLAFSFKNNFGLGGLSSNLIGMERGELIGITAICKRMGYGLTTKYKAYIWSIMRYLRRIILSSFEKLK